MTVNIIKKMKRGECQKLKSVLKIILIKGEISVEEKNYRSFI